MRKFVVGAVIFLLVVAQASFLPNFFPANFVPDAALVFIIIWIARMELNPALGWAIFGGLLMDLASFYPIGIHIFSFVLVVFMVNSLSKRFLVSQSAWKFAVLAAMIFFATMLNRIIAEFLIKIFTGGNIQEFIQVVFDKQLLGKPFYNLLLFAIMYWPIGRLNKFFSRQGQRIIIKS